MQLLREASKGSSRYTELKSLQNLSKTLISNDEATFAEKVATIKESYFSETKTKESIIDEEASDDEANEGDVEVTSAMAGTILNCNPQIC